MGRRTLLNSNPTILKELESLLEPAKRGDPESALTWTSKSTTALAEELNNKGFKISQKTVCILLHDLGFSLQSNNKRFEGAQHEDRDAQFNFIYRKIKSFQKASNPIISVDAKKKELVGNYKNTGETWNKKGSPQGNCSPLTYKIHR